MGITQTFKHGFVWVIYKMGLLTLNSAGGGGGGKNPQQPPDLDELWRDFNEQVKRIFGSSGKPPSKPNNHEPSGDAPGPKLPMEVPKNLIAIGLAVLFLIWLATGFFIVRDGQRGVITQFGQYHSQVEPGLRWRLPFPFQAHEAINTTQIREMAVGSGNIIPETGLSEAAMLTADKNIVEVRFVVQYRLKDVRAFLFDVADPEGLVKNVAESAVREVVGSMKMDDVLGSGGAANIAPKVQIDMQAMLEKYHAGVEIASINIVKDGLKAPEQVKPAFDDALKADQDANRVLEEAKAQAIKFNQEAQGYASRVVQQAEGDAQRFEDILPAYRSAPKAVRDRMYYDTMEQVYANTTKILIDGKNGQNLTYLPLDKILSQGQPSSGAASSNLDVKSNDAPTATKGRDDARSRTR